MFGKTVLPPRSRDLRIQEERECGLIVWEREGRVHTYACMGTHACSVASLPHLARPARVKVGVGQPDNASGGLPGSQHLQYDVVPPGILQEGGKVGGSGTHVVTWGSGMVHARRREGQGLVYGSHGMGAGMARPSCVTHSCIQGKGG